MVDFVIGMRPRRQAVFHHDAVVALPGPVAQVARASCADLADWLCGLPRGKGRIRNDRYSSSHGHGRRRGGGDT
jgi:hypothetical protein